MDGVRISSETIPSLPARERTERSAGPAASGSFRSHLAGARIGQLNERIDRALKEIDELGTRLGQTFSLADLKRYRQAISGLLKDLTTNMVQVRTDMEWDSQAWEHRTLVTVRTVDQELEKLTQMVVAQEQDRLGILAKIGEIKGMLLDLKV
jgi:uncharacterized protein YaaR (DUF327 family)